MKTVRTIEEIIEDKKMLGWPDEKIAEHLAELTGGTMNNDTLAIPIKTPAVPAPLAA
jgi:hypothetical protein